MCNLMLEKESAGKVGYGEKIRNYFYFHILLNYGVENRGFGEIRPPQFSNQPPGH